MARIRTIKPEFPQSETIGKLSRDARLLFIQLWTICDDSGRTRAASRMLSSLLYPYDDDARTLIPEWLIELDKAGCIRLYEVEGNSYLEIVKWASHQKIDRPSPSKFPAFDASSRAIAKPREASCSDQGREGTKDQGPGGEAEGAAAAFPAVISDVDEAFSMWSILASDLQIPDTGFLNGERRAALHARLHEIGGMEGWAVAIEKVREAQFFLEPSGKPKRWLHLGWLLKPENFTGLMEGRYAERHAKPASGLDAALAELGRAGAG